jgi:hypothetical protein
MIVLVNRRALPGHEALRRRLRLPLRHQSHATAAAGGNALCVSCSDSGKKDDDTLTCRGEADCASDRCSAASAGVFCDGILVRDYRGTVAATAGGLACQAWAA